MGQGDSTPSPIHNDFVNNTGDDFANRRQNKRHQSFNNHSIPKRNNPMYSSMPVRNKRGRNNVDSVKLASVHIIESIPTEVYLMRRRQMQAWQTYRGIHVSIIYICIDVYLINTFKFEGLISMHGLSLSDIHAC